jgi:hypothetical protein
LLLFNHPYFDGNIRMNQTAIPDAIEKLLGAPFATTEAGGRRWLEKRGPNSEVLRIILDAANGRLEFSWGTGLGIDCCEIRFHLEGATVVSFGESLRLVEASGFTLHLTLQEGRVSLFAWLPPDR